MIARAKSAAPSLESAATSAGVARSIFSEGNSAPITPVDAGTISFAAQPSARATLSHACSAAARPGAPVHAFAFPLFTRIARSFPPRVRARARSTGAAHTRLRVKTAAVCAPVSATASARSGFPFALIPAGIPAKRKPGTPGTTASSDSSACMAATLAWSARARRARDNIGA
jgi:hypothetical protein